MAEVLSAKGPNMEALSPRDVNAQKPPKTNDIKVKAMTQAATQAKAPPKDKEHPPPPPAQVIEPPSSDRKDGATYQVGKLLGKGGFAICHEGTLLPARKKFALKIVRSKMPPKMEQKFQTELQIHSKMRHPNVVQFFRAFAYESSTYLVLELCPNGSLMDMVKRRKGLTEPEVRFYTIQIAGAIKYMHSKGIIHRDLKMGNIFLDRHMNAKIGDFGLAALVVTGKDMQTIRRTTLCGTPNYIAPEILEKGKGGHDHMVDIWSLGIIMFAMLTSKPPFQSNTTDEIYRRAKERDYEWPEAGQSQKVINWEAKDLVATMLQEAEKRPEPDAIVQHEFFSSGFVPLPSDMTVRLRELPPDKAEFLMPQRQLQGNSQNKQNLMELCRMCEVGPWSRPQRLHSTIWREMAHEEKAGLTPIIPLAHGVVYRPFDEIQKEQQAAVLDLTAQLQSGLTLVDSSAASQRTVPALLRQPPQSFAAQLRAQNKPRSNVAPMEARSRPENAATTTESERPRPIREMLSSQATQEVAPRKASNSKRTPLPTLKPRVPSGELEAAKKEALPAPVQTKATSERSGPVTASLFSPLELQENVPGTHPDAVLDRLRKLQTELERALNARTMAIISAKDARREAPPRIVVKWVDYTNKFGLGYILNDGSVGCILKTIPSKEGTKDVILPPAYFLVRDAERHIQRRQDETYPDRHQLLPMTESVYFYENNGERGISRVRVDPESFRVPVGDDGTAAKLSVGKDIYDHRKRERLVLWKKFANYMMANGRDQGALPEDFPMDAQSNGGSGSQTSPDDVVTFYQRFGDVGCWVFCDGHIQLNFPDHTKIVLDPTGYWCHFWHLPQEAALKLAEKGMIDEADLDQRSVLSYPLQTLLNFSTKATVPRSTRTTGASSSRRQRPEIDPMLQGIPAANDFRRKIEFVRAIVREWVANGGLGNSDMSRERRLRWTGARETVVLSSAGDTVNNAGTGSGLVPIPVAVQKHVWVTIGARQGDQRFTALVDPRRPAEIAADIDESARRKDAE